MEIFPIVKSVEADRRTGFRGVAMPLEARYFLVAPALAHPCSRMPIPLYSALGVFAWSMPQARRDVDSWAWFTPREFLATAPPCRLESGSRARQLHVECRVCRAGHSLPPGPHGLVWLDAAAYPKPEDFRQEAQSRGVSVELASVPTGLLLGETVVYLVHPTGDRGAPAIVAAFRPTGVDIVANEPPASAIELARSLGATARIVNVVRES